MVQGATNGLACHQAGRELAAIMGAGAAYREELAVDPGQEHGLILHSSAQRALEGNVGKPYALRKIRPRYGGCFTHDCLRPRSEEHTSELQSLMRITYAVICLNKKKKIK